jgi:hypothetical protein
MTVSSHDRTQSIMERLQALLNADLTDEELELRLQSDFTEEEQSMVTDLIMGEIQMTESDRYFPD